MRGRVTRVAVCSVPAETPMDLAPGPECLWKRRIPKLCFVSRIHSGCKECENNQLLLCCSHTSAVKHGPDSRAAA